MISRALAALALALGAGVLARPAAAQAQKQAWVIRCQRDGVSSEPLYFSDPIVVETDDIGFVKERMQAQWVAYLAREKGKTGDYFVYCHTSDADNVVEAKALATFRTDNPRQQLTHWRPEFGALYEPPRDLYYFCTANEFRSSGSRRRLAVSDLFRIPMPVDPERFLGEQGRPMSVATYTQTDRAFGYQERCQAAAPEAYKHYVKWLNDSARQVDLVRATWRGPGEAAAPDLIDDLAARAKYANMRVTGLKQLANAKGPTPQAPPRKTGGPPPKIPALTVKSDPSIEENNRVLAEGVQKSLKKQADDKAKIAALKAKDDAEFKAKMDAFWAERRRQGNRQ